MPRPITQNDHKITDIITKFQSTNYTFLEKTGDGTTETKIGEHRYFGDYDGEDDDCDVDDGNDFDVDVVDGDGYDDEDDLFDDSDDEDDLSDDVDDGFDDDYGDVDDGRLLKHFVVRIFPREAARKNKTRNSQTTPSLTNFSRIGRTTPLSGRLLEKVCRTDKGNIKARDNGYKFMIQTINGC